MLRRVRAHRRRPCQSRSPLDPHANFTQQMVTERDSVSPYRTYPHVDMKATGQRADAAAAPPNRGRALDAKAFRQLDLLDPLPSQCTLMEPMQGVYAERAATEARHGLAELAFCFDSPYADFADCGAALVAYAETQEAADAAADGFWRICGAERGISASTRYPPARR